MDCKKAYKKLKIGNGRFVNSKQINSNIGVSNNHKLLSSQKPFAVILTCSDSRVGVIEIFDAKLGDLFIIKNAGNIISKSTLASMEFAIAKLDVKLILVLSHQNCGAVKYAKTHPETDIEKDKNLNYLLKQIRFVLTENKKLSTKEITKKNAIHSAEGIIENSIIIAEKVKEGSVKIITGYYKISTGEVKFYKYKSL
jgi:carbonic anhydrase